MQIIPEHKILGAKVIHADLSKQISPEDRERIVKWLGEYGVLAFTQQELTPQQLRDFSANFGELEINVAKVAQDPALPEVMTLSNMVEDGKPLGLSDAGQDWHTDMSYSKMIAFANILYGIKIPFRNGKSLGNTEFCNMQAAYEGLPEDIQKELENKTITHDFNKFWENMRQQKGSSRPPLTPEQRLAKPPVSHPAILVHPITQKKVLYANPGYSVRINELSESASDELLQFLFEHQLQDHNMGTIHNAVADYRLDEHRYIKRCQVAANLFFN